MLSANLTENPTLQKLLIEAIKAQKQAYAPYSTKLIGSSVLWSDDSITSGCNIENASYGATVCAERVAIWNGLSENKNRRIKEILVVSPSLPPWPPCGMCRQVIVEFANSEALVHWSDGETLIKTKSLIEMLPESFDNRFLV